MFLHGTLKNTKSSTHFRMGLIPLAQRRSARASPKRPNKPPAVVHPNELHVLSANRAGLLEIHTTTPGHWLSWSGMM